MIRKREDFEPSNKADPVWWWNSPLPDVWTDIEFPLPEGFDVDKQRSLTYVVVKDGVVRVRVYAKKRVVPENGKGERK